MNKSFNYVKKILKENGVKNTSFLEYNNIGKTQTKSLLKDNIWYYFENSLVPAQGGGVSPFKLNVGTCAFIYLFSKDTDAWVRLPRCSYITHTMKMCIEWYNNSSEESKAIYFDRKINPKMKAKMKKNPESFENDIAMVDNAECLSYADYNLIRNIFKHSYFASVIIRDADKKLIKEEDSFQLFTFDMYNNLPTNTETPILVTYPAEMIHNDHYFEFYKTALPSEYYKSEILLQRD